MINIFKKILLIILIIIISIIFYFLFFFNPNDFKHEIETYLSSKTGLEITYEGDIDIIYTPESVVSVPNIRVFENNNLIVEIQELNMIVATEKIKDKILDVKKIEAINLRYYGINIDDILLKTYSILSLQNISLDTNNITSLKHMSASAIVRDNAMIISNIVMKSQLLQASGQGKINIDDKNTSINLTGEILDKIDVSQQYINRYPEKLSGEELPIIISGKMENLSISIDLEKIIKKKINPIKDKIVDDIKDKVIDELKDKIKLPF